MARRRWSHPSKARLLGEVVTTHVAPQASRRRCVPAVRRQVQDHDGVRHMVMRTAAEDIPRRDVGSRRLNAGDGGMSLVGVVLCSRRRPFPLACGDASFAGLFRRIGLADADHFVVPCPEHEVRLSVIGCQSLVPVVVRRVLLARGNAAERRPLGRVHLALENALAVARSEAPECGIFPNMAPEFEGSRICLVLTDRMRPRTIRRAAGRPNPHYATREAIQLGIP